MDGDGKAWDSRCIKHYRTVDEIKAQLRKSNYCYLSRHPEIRAIIRVFLQEAISKKPDNIYEFAANLFNCNNTTLLITKINEQLKRVNALLKQGQWMEYDGEMLFSKNESSHSLLSESSLSEHVDNLLKYSLVLKNP